MNQVHLTKEEYTQLLNANNLSTKHRIIPLDCGVAGYVNYIVFNDTLYYEDFFYGNDELLNIHFAHAFNILHAEIYWKLALMNKYYA